MPSKKRKYNARFPAGRIKKIMQTDEEVGKVAQAVPIIISRTLELFVESLLKKSMQVTMSRNAKTLSPSHVKQCILNEARFDFLRDLVKNIPDVSAAEEKEMMSAESSPNSSRFSETSAPPRRIVREDSNSSSSCELRIPSTLPKSSNSDDSPKLPVTSTIVSADKAIDLTKKEEKTIRTANFYQETLVTERQGVIKINPTYSNPQPSTSTFTNLTSVPIDQVTVPKTPHQPVFHIDLSNLNNNTSIPSLKTPVTPLLNIDFSKNVVNPEIKVLNAAMASIVGVNKGKNPLSRQNSKTYKPDAIKVDIKPQISASRSIDIDHLNSGNLQIDEDYDT